MFCGVLCGCFFVPWPMHVWRVVPTAVLLASPTWPTYKPQAEAVGHKPYIVTSSFENQWRITPENLEKVSRVPSVLYTLAVRVLLCKKLKTFCCRCSHACRNVKLSLLFDRLLWTIVWSRVINCWFFAIQIILVSLSALSRHIQVLIICCLQQCSNQVF